MNQIPMPKPLSFVRECSLKGLHLYDECDGPHVFRLALCESTTLVLRQNQLYIFEAVEGCSKCSELADLS